MRADVYYRMKEFYKAFETFRNAMKINSDDLTVINNYGILLAEQIQIWGSGGDGKRLWKGQRKYYILDTYGWVLYKRGKTERKLQKFMESIINKGDKTDAVWYEHYVTYWKKQKKCERSLWQTGKSLFKW